MVLNERGEMAVDITIPSPGESITEVSMSGWLKKDGSYVERDELLAEIESDKATLELRAPASGLLKIGTAKGDGIKVGAVVASIDTSAAKPAGSSDAKSDASSGGSGESHAARLEPTRVSGVARKVAAERGVDPATVTGSGPSGRVMKDDVIAAAAPAKS